MAWTTPKTWLAGGALIASDFNTHIRDNLLALKSPPTDSHSADEASDWTTTSNSFVAIDGTDLSLSLTTTGGDIIVHFHGNVAASVGANVYFQLVLDGAGVVGDDGHIGLNTGAGAPGRNVSFTRLLTGVGAGAHTIVINWKTSAGTATLYGGAGTASGDLHPQFWAREVS